MKRHNPAAPLEEGWVRRIVSTHACDLEYAQVGYEDGTGPEEEFGPEPY